MYALALRRVWRSQPNAPVIDESVAGRGIVFLAIIALIFAAIIADMVLKPF